jgi:LysM repeat protein
MKELAEQGIITAAEAKRVEKASEEVKDVVKEEVSDDVIEYLVVRGDCLYRLAKKFNCSISEILKLNPKIKNPDLIYAGQILLLPE